MDKFKRALTLRGWFRLMVAVVLVSVLLGEVRLIQMAWQQWERAEAGQQAVTRLRLGLLAAEMVSRERGPSNGVMGDEQPGGSPALRQALQVARARTDQAVQDFQSVWTPSSPAPRDRMVVLQLVHFQQRLQAARATVDALASRPQAQRRQEDIRAAVGSMINLVPLLAPPITRLADEAQLADPALGVAVWGARLAAHLREYAGQLGSWFTPALARAQPISAADLAHIERVKGRVDELRYLLDLRLGAMTEDTDAIRRAHHAMERDYFVQGVDTVQRVLAAAPTGQYGLSAAEFAAQYVPTMNAIIGLRDALLLAAERHCVAEEARARFSLWFVSISTTLLLALILWMLRLAHQRFVLPLSQAADVLHAMSAGDHDRALPIVTADDEMADVVGAIAALRQQSLVRQELERERDKLIATLREQSTTDFLTGLPNRRAFFEAAELELARARRHGFGVALLLLDVDHFKRVNDTVGHAGGDTALQAVAAILRQTARQVDLVARLGGEEFVALLTHCGRDEGLGFAERLRTTVAAQPIELGEGQSPLHLTVSIGLADSATNGLLLDTLMARADDAMYRAKAGGRNRTALSDESTG
jgi:diguanylate cyclase (GGDEF)-like protein